MYLAIYISIPFLEEIKLSRNYLQNSPSVTQIKNLLEILWNKNSRYKISLFKPAIPKLGAGGQGREMISRGHKIKKYVLQ